MAAAELGVPAERARLAFPGGAAQMIDAWFDCDRQGDARRLPARAGRGDEDARPDPGAAPVPPRGAAPAPRGAAPRRSPSSLCRSNALDRRAAWPGAAADRIWRARRRHGDRLQPLFSKRAILIGVYGSTSLVFLDDDSEDMAETRAFLDRRIDDVMRFEKAKARWRGTRERLPSISRFLGRLRYPAA